MSVLSRDGPSKRARLVDKFELLSEAEQRQLLRGSQLSRADTIVSLSGPASEIGSLDQAMGEASISSIPVSTDLGRPMDSRPDEAQARPAPTTVASSPSDSRPLGGDSDKEQAEVLSTPQKAEQDPEPTEPISGMRSHSPAVSSGPREPEAKIRALFPVPPKVV